MYENFAMCGSNLVVCSVVECELFLHILHDRQGLTHQLILTKMQEPYIVWLVEFLLWIWTSWFALDNSLSLDFVSSSCCETSINMPLWRKFQNKNSHFVSLESQNQMKTLNLYCPLQWPIMKKEQQEASQVALSMVRIGTWDKYMAGCQTSCAEFIGSIGAPRHFSQR